MSSLLSGGIADREEPCMLPRSGRARSRRCGRYRPAKVKVPLRTIHRRSRGLRGGSGAAGLGARHLPVAPGIAQHPSALAGIPSPEQPGVCTTIPRPPGLLRRGSCAIQWRRPGPGAG